MTPTFWAIAQFQQEFPSVRDASEAEGGNFLEAVDSAPLRKWRTFDACLRLLMPVSHTQA